MNYKRSSFYNWISLSGLVLAVAALFAFVLLFVFDLTARTANPYVGILTYMVAPGFFTLGLVMFFGGALWQRRQLRRQAAGLEASGRIPLIDFDFNRPGDRRRLWWFSGAAAGFLMVTAVATYQSYQLTESNVFCGQVCHMMGPELHTFNLSPHARVDCIECHVGPGAEAMIQSKITGAGQLVKTLRGTYNRPIPVPVDHLRSAEIICEQCHWPEKHVGNVERTFTSFLSDEDNTQFSARMIFFVGGPNPKFGRVAGIHAHEAYEIDFAPTDRTRSEIAWIRSKAPDGTVTEYRSPNLVGDPAPETIRRMDCVDCHNRTAHPFYGPNDGVDRALDLGFLDPTIKNLRRVATEALAEPYGSVEEAMAGIEKALTELLGTDERLRETVAAVQNIYRDNFFPRYKADWRAFPDHLGHKNSAGCFRCHGADLRSVGAGLPLKIGANDCNACHVVVAQGQGEELRRFDGAGLPYAHPGGDFGESKCFECHTGGP